jgi:hypothetical protein
VRRAPGTLKTTGFIRFAAGAFEGLILVRDKDEGWIPTHGHNDLLSVVLDCNGDPLLIDPGTGGYAWDRKLRHLLRSTASHSTLQVEEIEQSPISERRTFEGAYPPQCKVESFRPDPLEIRASCRIETGDWIHERKIRSDSGFIRIEDRLLATRPERDDATRKSHIRFILAPGLKPARDVGHPSLWSVEMPTETVRFLFLHPKAADWQSLTVPASRRYGSKETVAALVGSFKDPLPHRWTTILAPPNRSVEELTAFADEQATEGT